jgi:hypothetical protein
MHALAAIVTIASGHSRRAQPHSRPDTDSKGRARRVAEAVEWHKTLYNNRLRPFGGFSAVAVHSKQLPFWRMADGFEWEGAGQWMSDWQAPDRPNLIAFGRYI